MSEHIIERRNLACDVLPEGVGLKVLCPEVILTEERQGGQERAKQIVGYSAVFGVDTEIPTLFGSFRERIQKGAFRRAIREGQDVRALRNHNPDNLLGRTLSKTLRLKEDDIGLFIEVDVANNTIGRDTVESIERGDLSGMSFAFVVRKEKWINGEDGAPDLRIVQDVDLYDVGPVTYPAYKETSADARAESTEIYKRGKAEVKEQRSDEEAEQVTQLSASATAQQEERGTTNEKESEADEAKPDLARLKRLLEKNRATA